MAMEINNDLSSYDLVPTDLGSSDWTVLEFAGSDLGDRRLAAKGTLFIRLLWLPGGLAYAHAAQRASPHPRVAPARDWRRQRGRKGNRAYVPLASPGRR